MNAFTATAKNTYNKILGHKKYKVFFIISCLLVLFFTFFSRGGMQLTIGSLTFSFTNGAFLALSVLGALILPLLAFMLGADMFASEIADHTIKNELMRPVGKVKLYFAKLTGIMFYCITILLASFTICAAVSLFGGWANKLVIIFFAHVMSIILCCVFVTFASLIAVWTANSSLTMFLSILIYIALTVLSALFTSFGAISFTGYYSWFKMIMGSVIPWKNVFVTLGLLLSYIGVFTTIGQLLFDKRDAA